MRWWLGADGVAASSPVRHSGGPATQAGQHLDALATSARWTANPSSLTTACHLFHLNYYALLSLVGLLEAARGTKAQSNAVELLKRLKLDQETVSLA